MTAEENLCPEGMECPICFADVFDIDILLIDDDGIITCTRCGTVYEMPPYRPVIVHTGPTESKYLKLRPVLSRI